MQGIVHLNKTSIFAVLLEDKELITEGRAPYKINVICQLELDFRDTEKKENHFIGLWQQMPGQKEMVNSWKNWVAIIPIPIRLLLTLI